MIKVAIVYGWAEGPWQGDKFTKALEQYGYTTTLDPREADIIFGHSLGCYLVPKDIKNKTVCLVGLPYWPGRSVIYSVALKLKKEISYHRQGNSLAWWVNKTAHNSLYIFSRPRLTYYGITRIHPRFLPNGANNKVIVIRPADDTFCHPEVAKILPQSKNYQYLEVPGPHDGCWFEPRPYIELFNKNI